MPGLIVRILVTAAGLALAAFVVPGITVSGPGTLLLAALLMGLVNGIVRPFIYLITLPLTIVTFGLFLLVVNAAMFGLVASLIDGFDVAGFAPAFFGWLIVSAIGSLATWYIGPNGRYQVIVIDRRR